jgi:hypothetical protein
MRRAGHGKHRLEHSVKDRNRHTNCYGVSLRFAALERNVSALFMYPTRCSVQSIRVDSGATIVAISDAANMATILGIMLVPVLIHVERYSTGCDLHGVPP